MLDAGAHSITEAMALAAARAIADRVRDDEINPTASCPASSTRGRSRGRRRRPPGRRRRPEGDGRRGGRGVACLGPPRLDDPRDRPGGGDRLVRGQHRRCQAARCGSPRSPGATRTSPTGSTTPPGEMVLRRPPLGELLPTAHDMGREHRDLGAVPTPVPVREPLAFTDDRDVTGAPFYAMGCVDGIVARDEPPKPPPGRGGPVVTARRSSTPWLACTQLDPDRWASAAWPPHAPGAPPSPLAARAGTSRDGPCPTWTAPPVWPRACPSRPARPSSTATTACTRPLPRRPVLAGLDWEISTLGDPLADLGLLQVYWAEPGDRMLPLGLGPHRSCPGFPGRAAVAEAYATLSGRDLSQLDTYVGLRLLEAGRSSSRAWSPAMPPAPTARVTTAGAGSPRWSSSWPTGPWS